MKSCLIVGLQILERLEQLHKHGFIFRDVKPENFLIGSTQRPASNMIYMVDFGLTTPFMDKSNNHIGFCNEKQIIGTARWDFCLIFLENLRSITLFRYMSINAHLCKTQSRRDDLESLGYVLVYLMKGFLPWQNILTLKLKENLRRIKILKLKHTPEMLCKVTLNKFLTYS